MIKFVYLDVGGVLVKDFSASGKWSELMAEIGINPEHRQEFTDFYDLHEPELCLGKDTDEFFNTLKEKFNLQVREDYSFLIDGFVNRFEKNTTIWPIITRIKADCQIGLLTNMYPRMLTEIKNRMLLPDINWDAVIDSSVEKAKKPDTEIFLIAQQRCGFAPKEILFIDNSIGNIQSAKDLGWQTIFYDSHDYSKSTDKVKKIFLFNPFYILK